MLKRKATRELRSDVEHGGAAPAPASASQHQQDAEQPRPALNAQPQAQPAGAMQVPQPAVAGGTRLQTGVHSLSRLSRAGAAPGAANEDTFLVATLQQAPGAAGPQLPPMHLLAVFDGHSSASVSSMCAASVQQVVTQLLEREAAAAAGALDDAAVHRVLQQAFEQLDGLVQPLDNSGSTATVALVAPDRLHLAWVGDSRAALLGRNGAVLASTLEHRAHREDEQERVAAAGGTILNNSGLRVMGVLQCTRAIGDKDLQPYGVISRPDVLSLPRTGQEEFLVLATDGLWDVLSNEEVYDYAHKTLKKVEDRCARQPSSSGACCGCQAAGVAARALAQCARKQRGSRDDITVVLANLGSVCSCLRPPAVLSSATGNPLPGTCSSGSSHGIVGLPSTFHNVHAELHSSPAALDASAAGPTMGALQAEQPWQPQPALSSLQQAQPPLQQQQQQPPAAAAAQQQQQQQQLSPLPRQHIVRQCVRRSPLPHAALLMQPSVAPAHVMRSRQGRVTPGTDAAAAAAGAHAHGHADAAAPHSTPLSDLAMSSPFAMVLGDVVDVALEVDVEPLHAPWGSHPHAAVAAGKSAPPGVVAALSAGAPPGSLRQHSHSLNVALSNSRSCGSAGASQQGRLGSAELPVVVLT